MSYVTYPSGPFVAHAPDTDTDAERERLPAPQPFGAPVLISDAITPLAGETVLSLLMKRMASGDQ